MARSVLSNLTVDATFGRQFSYERDGAESAESAVQSVNFALLPWGEA